MRFKVNDTVAVLDDVIKGKVVSISNTKVTIESTDGFSFDFSMDCHLREDTFSLV